MVPPAEAFVPVHAEKSLLSKPSSNRVKAAVTGVRDSDDKESVTANIDVRSSIVIASDRFSLISS
jgi:hypothetical protein